MDRQLGYKNLLEGTILPILKDNFYSYILTGEHNYGDGSTKYAVNLNSSNNAWLTMDMYPESKFFKEFTNDILSTGVMRTSWYSYCRNRNHPKLGLIKKFDPLFKEVFDKYTLMLVDMPDVIKGNRTHMIIKSGCNGMYASYLLVHGYKKAMANETVTY